MAEEKKKKSPWLWIALACVGCLVILGCICSVIGILCVTSDEFKTSFEESYCDQLEEQGMSTSEDPFGICD